MHMGHPNAGFSSKLMILRGPGPRSTISRCFTHLTRRGTRDVWPLTFARLHRHHGQRRRVQYSPSRRPDAADLTFRDDKMPASHGTVYIYKGSNDQCLLSLRLLSPSLGHRLAPCSFGLYACSPCSWGSFSRLPPRSAPRRL